MGFRNPAQIAIPPDLARESTDKEIETRVTEKWFPDRDEMFWPCRSGENYPPTLSGAAYSSLLGRSMITTGSRGTIGVNSASWGDVPRLSPLPGKNTLRLSFLLGRRPLADDATLATGWGGIVYGTTDSNFGRDPGEVTSGTNRAVRLFKRASGANIEFETATSAGVEATVTDVPLNADVWYSIEIVLTPTTIELWIDDVLKAEHTTRIWEPGAASAQILAAYVVVEGQNKFVYDRYIAALRAGWE